MRKTIGTSICRMLGGWAALVFLAAGACGADPGTKAEAEQQAAPAEAAEEGGAVVVTVEGEELTQGEVDRQIMQMLASRGMRGVSPDQLAQFRPMIQKQIVENFVANTVLRKEAARKEVEVPEAEVEKALEDLRGRIPPGASFDQLLEQAGMTQEKLHQDVEESLKVRKLLEQQTEGKIDVTEEEMKAYYDESKASFSEPEKVTASHILFKVDEGAGDEDRETKRKAAEAAREKLVKGADFAELAEEVSDCPSSAQGGSLGAFARGQMVKPFEEAAFSQEIGAVGPVVETKFGYHIIKVTDRSDAEQKEFAEVKEDIEDKLENRKRNELVQAYVAELRETAEITYTEK